MLSKFPFHQVISQLVSVVCADPAVPALSRPQSVTLGSVTLSLGALTLGALVYDRQWRPLQPLHLDEFRYGAEHDFRFRHVMVAVRVLAAGSRPEVLQEPVAGPA